MAPAGINDPSSYYAGGGTDPSLFWEMTICQCLAGPESPYLAALERPEPYGALLARALRARLGRVRFGSVLEVGGGYGTLMAAFHAAVPVAETTLVDISPFFSQEQRRALAGRPGVRVVTADALSYLAGFRGEVDLVISNENLGDLPTVTGVRRDDVRRCLEGRAGDGLVETVAAAFRRYGLDLDGAPEQFHFNLGAIRYLEALRPVARAVFLSEHGADTVLPDDYAFLPLDRGDGYPRRVRLRGHDEYSIRFGDLERVAEALGFRVARFHLAELVGLRRDAGIQAMARADAIGFETVEVVHEFCRHVAEYQCMLLWR